MRITISFDKQEAEALQHIAYKEMRWPRDQVRLFVRQELQRRGLLPDDAAALPFTSSRGQDATNNNHSTT